MSFPENKKSSPWKVFGINHPQTLQLLSRRGPRCTVTRLSQHYIGENEILLYFKFLQKKDFLHLLNESRGFVTWFFQITIPKGLQKCRGTFCQAWKPIFWPMWCWDSLTSGPLWLLLLKSHRVRGWFIQKNFSRAVFFCFLGNSFGW